MNLILLFKEDFISTNVVRLDGRRKEHIQNILKSKINDTLTVGLCDGQMGKGKLLKSDDMVEIEVAFDLKPPEALELTLILALPRPHLLKRSLFFAAMLGIKNIHLLHFNRVEKSLWNSSSLKPDAIKQHLTLGLEQAKDTIMPQVFLHSQFKPFVEDQMPAIIKGTTTIVADPSGGALSAHSIKKPITLIIGPEGGIVPFELNLLAAAGAKPIHFGQRILRVDAALAYIVSKLP